MGDQQVRKAAPAPRWVVTARRLLLGAIAVLFVISIPWYRGDAEVSLWFGLPDWVAVALICYVGVAVLNSVAWLLTDIPDAPDDRPADPR